MDVLLFMNGVCENAEILAFLHEKHHGEAIRLGRSIQAPRPYSFELPTHMSLPKHLQHWIMRAAQCDVKAQNFWFVFVNDLSERSLYDWMQVHAFVHENRATSLVLVSNTVEPWVQRLSKLLSLNKIAVVGANDLPRPPQTPAKAPANVLLEATATVVEATTPTATVVEATTPTATVNDWECNPMAPAHHTRYVVHYT